MPKSRWFIKALGIFLALLAIWVASALFLSAASAGGHPFSMGLRSNLAANYAGEGSDLSFGPIKLSILQEALIDLGLSSDEAGEVANETISGLDGPVPTATAVDFDGNAPLTATPKATATATPIPTETPAPTDTPPMIRVATRVPVNSATPQAVGTAVPSDGINPIIANPGTITPTPGPLASCSRRISVSNVQITDAPISSGIRWVKLKYKVYDNAESTIYAGYIFSSALTKCSGGFTPLGGWDACYDGPAGGFDIAIYPGFSALPDYTGPGPFKAKVWLITEDLAGNSNSYYYGAYEMPATCDDPPPPTATATALPTDTTPPSILSLDLSPTPGSVLISCTLTVNDLHIFDPAFSSGISASGVQIKHTSISHGDQYLPLTVLTGNFVSGPGSDWDGHASGTIILDELGNDEAFLVYGVLQDVAGNGPVVIGPYNYTAPSVGCDS